MSDDTPTANTNPHPPISTIEETTNIIPLIELNNNNNNNTANNRRPWVEKYRPKDLNDVVAHEQILGTLKRLIYSGSMPHLLFYGPPGTGKTTTVQACARELFGDRVRGNVLELNASDDRGIDVVRNQIKDFASTGSMYAAFKTNSVNNNNNNSGLFSNKNDQGDDDTTTTNNNNNNNINNNNGISSTPQPKAAGFKLIVLDEADQMSHDAQAALRRVIEKYTKNVRFCILCNHINKIIPAVQSRCTRFRFAPVKKSAMLPRLIYIAEKESTLQTPPLIYTTDGLSAAFKLSSGDLRRCINLLQATSLSKGEITESSVYDVSGSPKPSDIATLGTIMLSTEYTEAFAQATEIIDSKGLSMVDVITELHNLIQKMDLPKESKWFSISKLADFECQIAVGCSDSIVLSGVLGVLQIIRESITTQTPCLVLAKC